MDAVNRMSDAKHNSWVDPRDQWGQAAWHRRARLQLTVIISSVLAITAATVNVTLAMRPVDRKKIVNGYSVKSQQAFREADKVTLTSVSTEKPAVSALHAHRDASTGA